MKDDAFELANGVVTQVLTLATASLGGIVALFDDKSTAGVQLSGGFLVTGMCLLALSVAAGVATMGGLTAELARSDGERPSVNERDVRLPAMVQISAFALGIILVVLHVLV